MSPALPPALVAVLEALADGRSGRMLAEKAQAISAGYRAGAPSQATIRDGDDALAYALTRMPATYAAVGAALEALTARTGDWAPRTLTDAGCGPGSASLAAFEAFEHLAECALIDANPRMLDLAQQLLSGAPATVAPRLADIASADLPRSDLVVAAYVLTEAPQAQALAMAARLWAAAEGALVIVEPGTPRAWERLTQVRSMLINVGAAVAAPCPHQAPCPVAPPDWCHFAQRLPRLRAHRLAKGAEAPFEDEKFAYLAVVRPAAALAPAGSRVLAPPVHDKAGMTLKLCEPQGDLARRHIPRRDKPAFKLARRAAWGEVIGG